MNVVGVDLGGMSIRAALVSELGNVLARVSAPVRDRGDRDAILEDLAALVESIPGALDASAVGVGAAGPLDHVSGSMYSPPNLPGLVGAPVGPLLSRRLGMPVFLENDANAAAFGEYAAGIGAGSRVFIALTLGTGVGGGVVIDGALLRGPDGCAAELGHISIDPSGPTCGCGSTGCLEVYASATAAARRFADQVARGDFPAPERLGKPASEADSADVFELAKAGDAGAANALAETGRMLGIGIASLVNVFNPDAIALLGGLSGAYEFFEKPVAKAVRERSFAPANRRVKIARGSLMGDAGMVGAALLARSRAAQG